MQSASTRSTDSSPGNGIKLMEFWSWEFWKIYAPIVAMMIFGACSYTTIRLVKDAVVMKYAQGPALKILKTSIVLVGVVLFNAFYGFLMRKFKDHKQRALYTLIIIFAGFYGLMSIALLYIQDLQIDDLHRKLMANLPHNMPNALRSGLSLLFEYVDVLVGKWVVSLFYFFTEIYGLCILQMICWVFANALIPSHLKMTAGLITNCISNLLTILATVQVANLSGIEDKALFGSQVSTFCITICVLPLLVILCLSIYLGESNSQSFANIKSKGKSDAQSDKKDSFVRTMWRTLTDSYASKIAIMVFCYNFLIGASDLVYKSVINLQYPEQFSNITVSISNINALISVILALIGISLFSGFSWRVKALIPALSLGGAGVLFYSFYIFRDFGIVKVLAGFVSLSPANLVILMGCTQSVLGKSTKYTFFDVIKSCVEEFLNIIYKGCIDSTINKIAKSLPYWIILAVLLFKPFDEKVHVQEYVNYRNELMQEKEALQGEHVAHAKPETHKELVKKAKSDYEIKATAPFMLVIFVCIFLLWMYSVMALYPKYKVNLIKKDLDKQVEHKLITEDDAEKKFKKESQNMHTELTFREIFALISLFSVIMFAVGFAFRLKLRHIFNPRLLEITVLIWNYLSAFINQHSHVCILGISIVSLILLGLWVFVIFAIFSGNSFVKKNKIKIRAGHIIGLSCGTALAGSVIYLIKLSLLG